jgi:heme-degrading monooxygenase HmoA
MNWYGKTRPRAGGPVCLALALLAGCESARDVSPNDMRARLERLSTCSPSDLVVVAPWMGPGFDEQGELREPLPAGHIEVVAQGWRKYDRAATELRERTGATVLHDALPRDGLIGFESVESEECDISIAHTLWRDEAAMFEFVSSPAHADAMAHASTMHHAFKGAHWSGEARDAPPTWREGVARFVQEARADFE